MFDDMERAWKQPSVEISPNCPRCGSSNTKFCYYNNYSLTQPRYFCKGCRRYWTKGGSLRNVPVGGGCRKNRRGNSNSNNKSLRDNINKSGYVSSTGQTGHGSDNLLPGGSHIDLAQVYANFLSSSDDKKVGVGVTVEAPVGFDPDRALLPGMDLDSGTGQLSDGSNQLGCFGELDSVLDHQRVVNGYDEGFGLPPFPGEEVGSIHHHHHQDQDQESLWSNSAPSSMVHHHGHGHALMQSSSSTSQLLGIEPDEPNLVMSGVSWSPFDLSTFDTFSRP